MLRNKIRKSFHRYSLQVPITVSGVVRSVPSQYSVYLVQDFRICVPSEILHNSAKGKASIKFG